MSSRSGFLFYILLLVCVHLTPIEPKPSTSIDPQSAPTNPTRTSNVNLYCSPGSRTDLISNDEIAAANFSHHVLNNIFSNDGYSLNLFVDFNYWVESYKAPPRLCSPPTARKLVALYLHWGWHW